MDEPMTMSPLMFLLKLAWDCRYRIPLIITIGFMALDIRMQFELNVQTRRVRRVSVRSARSSNPSDLNTSDSPDALELDDSWMSAEDVNNSSDSESNSPHDSGPSNFHNHDNAGNQSILANILQTNLESLSSQI
ncbi:hypothetical protein HHI36_016055 [Cryptolaemus montrouzieri]|uniref:Uncharacterized protein n=1 Tax=Cryptolaemus montrouzieri TaxID=559131 RepID=A0ABD2N8Y3_9CUCU